MQFSIAQNERGNLHMREKGKQREEDEGISHSGRGGSLGEEFPSPSTPYEGFG